ncbi:cytochrome c oxidase subunit I [Reyranella sp.]|jgi:cytochrome c oxidase subunit I+III|uniref:cytochrome c oxidase subunit I n=1 Tax=Reyranella sp. TaxID=1929291 RepID=UPI000BDAE7AB|nr:cytochrome c oxidase subunit I [Reyranella sp.]OYY37202.1 MAG: cytochrome c oxidase subunit I [Rhodospirillales bacterium 35-66-84]OYZ94174.1 MAG: cytochrome c oxidase subunit I [Rhodospirillales bacterium 24-66-33]OZB23015.1 MAG: cytochrome c oxidase subunit I [Rhodospirillales bacterium 39-66-50]HQS17190.1 cytochrome c oxidase subunit I [Reyranella sp.]HQT13739.1 cytochrome c oxidase subunit I [Reyranella sp.]
MNALRRHRALEAIWGAPKGWRGTAVSVNHSDIGKRFVVAAFVFFAIGGVLAMMIRAQLATPGSAFVGPDIYNQLFTMHGSIMMFLFAIPMFEGLALYMLPKMLGSRDMAFPRLSAYGWWCYLFGGTILIASMIFGVAPDGGWFMYTPLSSKAFTPGINADVWLLGITFVEISAISAAIEITVSVLKLRAPGMRLDRMPLFAWYLLITALMMIVAFPPLILGSILLEVERAFDWPFFDPSRGGSPLLWQHLFWLFGHPEVYIIFLPAAGVISTVLPVLARTRILGYGWIVAALLALAFLSFGLWVHHMFTTGIPHMALGFFSAASALVALPTAVQVFAWIGTLWNGRPELKLPMLYLLGFFVIFVIGGMTGVMLAMVPFDLQAHDTHFVVAHLHYVLIGGFIFPMLAGAYYWLPHFTGRTRDDLLGKASFWMIFVGFNVTFFMMHLTGLLGMRRRVHTYPEEAGWTLLNLVSSVGSFVMAFGFALFAIDVALHLYYARRRSRNPWTAGTLEWAMPIPTPAYNIASLPTVADREPLADAPALATSLARGEGYLGQPRHGWRETMAVETTSGAIDHVVVLPGNTRLPIVTAVVTGCFFLCLLAGQYWLSLLPVAGVVALGLRWAWVLDWRRDIGPLPIGRGEVAPIHREAAGAPGWWGSAFLLVADGTALASLLFGYAFLWVIAPNWPPPERIDGGLMPGLLAAVAAAAGSLFARRSLAASADGALGPAGRAALAGAAAQLGTIVALGTLGVTALPAPQEHAYAACSWALLAYSLLHALIALLCMGFARARVAAGHVSPRRTLDLRVARLFIDYSGATLAIVLVCLLAPAVAS